MLRRTVETPIPASDFVSTGSVLLNLACSGKHKGGIPKGCYVFMPGQSNSGKTWITMSVFAEAKKSKRFKDYRLIRDDTEHGDLMHVPTYFGQEVADSIEDVSSETAEAFWDNVEDAIDKGQPFIYCLDSMEGLSSEANKKYHEEAKKARRSGKKVKGTYAGSQQRTNSQRIRDSINKLKDTGSILIITGQTRKNMGMDAMFNPEVATGGEALFFWAHLRIWCRRAGKMKKTARKKDRIVGDKVRITVDKSRVTGKNRTVKLYIPNDFGIDDTGSMIHYLIDEKAKDRLKAMGLKGDPDEMAVQVEEQNKERELRLAVQEVWDEIEQACTVRRKPRYE